MSDTFLAMVADRVGDGVAFTAQQFTKEQLPVGDTLIRVQYSGVNYKDALATSADGKVATTYPLVPGIDLAGTVVACTAGHFPVGARVVAIGYDLGVARHGGYAQFARVPSEWVTELPETLSTREAMVIGTAGFTAAMSVARIQAHGIRPGDGPVLVTGASGGVGSVAVNLLAGLGFDVTASTGKADTAGLLTSLGASTVVDRSAWNAVGGRPLGKQQWAAAVDCVGGQTLANVLSSVSYGGLVAASGLTGGASLPTTVLPFILRAVTLAGIDSVQLPIDTRRALWARLGGDLRPSGLEALATDVPLTDVSAALDLIRAGASIGRTVVAVN